MMLNTQTTTEDVHTEKPSLKEFLSFLIARRGFFSLVAVTWGFMLGGTALIITTLAAIALLGGNWWTASFLCCVFGSYILYFAFPGMRKIYRQSRTTSTVALSRLFAVATLYGATAPFYTIYLLGRIFYLKHKLIGVINQSNSSALERRQKLSEMHSEVIRLKNEYKRKALVLPRGSSQITIIQLEIDSMRHSIRTADEENEAYLLECRREARELGIVLREENNIVSLPPDVNVLNLLSLRIKSLTILGSN